MAKKYKYKREHFDTNEEYASFRKRATAGYRKWLEKHEKEHPEYKERRILRQRLYSRYYWHGDGRQTFAQWLEENLGIKDIKVVPLEDLRVIASKS